VSEREREREREKERERERERDRERDKWLRERAPKKRVSPGHGCTGAL
jgi:hypothetical protein